MSYYKRQGNKYNNQKQEYNGKRYDSIKEANYAMELDWLKKAGEIKEIIPQYKIELEINGIHICNYYIDFKVIYSDGHEEYHEVKGFETDIWRMKWRLSKAIYKDWIFVLIK